MADEQCDEQQRANQMALEEAIRPKLGYQAGRNTQQIRAVAQQDHHADPTGTHYQDHDVEQTN